MPAASRIDSSRYEVVVLPLVPVMPTSTRSLLGIAKERGRQRGEREARVTHLQPRHTGGSTGWACRFGHDRERAAGDGIAGKFGSVVLEPLERDDTDPRATCRESLVTDATFVAAIASAIGVPTWASKGARPAVARRRSPNVTAGAPVRCGGCPAEGRVQHAVPDTAALPAAGDCSRTKPSAIELAGHARAASSRRLASRALSPRRSGITLSSRNPWSGLSPTGRASTPRRHRARAPSASR